MCGNKKYLWSSEDRSNLHRLQLSIAYTVKSSAVEKLSAFFNFKAENM